jgi:hypothetical protein
LTGAAVMSLKPVEADGKPETMKSTHAPVVELLDESFGADTGAVEEFSTADEGAVEAPGGRQTSRRWRTAGSSRPRNRDPRCACLGAIGLGMCCGLGCNQAGKIQGAYRESSSNEPAGMDGDGLRSRIAGCFGC